MFDKALLSELAIIQEGERWNRVIMYGLYRWINSPRDVIRFANSIKFAFSAAGDEVDPVDIIAMEGFRLFQPDVFSWIIKHRNFFFSEGEYMGGSHDDKITESLATVIDEADSEATIDLLALMFPSKHKAILGNDLIGFSEPFYSIRSRRGVGCKEGFYTYIAFRLSDDAIAKRSVDGIIDRIGDAQWLTSEFESFIEQSDKNTSNQNFLVLIDEIKYRFHYQPDQIATPALLEALFNISDAAFRLDSDAKVGFFNAQQHVSFLVADILRSWPTQQASDEFIRNIEASRSAVVRCAYLADRARELEQIPSVGDPGASSISEAALRKAADIVRTQLQKSDCTRRAGQCAFFIRHFCSLALAA